MAECILVTEEYYVRAEHAFNSYKIFDVERVSTQEQLLADAVLAKKCRAVVVGVESYIGPLYEALGETGQGAGAIIARFGVGHDNIDKNLSRKYKIIVTNTPGVLDISVAEHAIWLMGCLAKHLVSLGTDVKAGNFLGRGGRQMRGRTLGIMGFGAIGRRVAAIAHFGFGMRVIAADILPATELAKREKKTFEQIKTTYGLDSYTNDIDAVLREADVLTVHMPANSHTLNFFNADRFTTMKCGAMLINTSRGSVIDESALYDALTNGHLAGAGLDVFVNEPYEPVAPDKDLRKLENVVLTPHTASNTVESNEGMAKACLGNIANFFSNRLNRLTRSDTSINDLAKSLKIHLF
jgi:D-3-phosphoglycerate dehydrogenase